MPFPNPSTQFGPHNNANPAGRPKGSKSWSTVVRKLLEDENFEIKFKNGETKKYPAKVIAEVMIKKAASGDVQAFRELRKTGYGDQLDITTAGEALNSVKELTDEELRNQIDEYLKRHTAP